MSDLGLILTDSKIDINITSAGIQLDNGLETAILLSLFTDQQVPKAQLPPGQTDRRGWWGDQFLSKSGDKIGSKTWSVTERQKLNPQTAVKAQTRARQALEWLIEDGVAAEVSVLVTVQVAGVGRFLQFEIKIKRPTGDEDKFFMQWDGQEVIR